MKKITFIHTITLFFLIVFLSYSCSNNESKNSIQEEVVPVDCSVLHVDDFDAFLGLPYGSEERDLQFRLGKFTSGLFTEDSSAFIYYFNRVKRAPLSVWVSVESGKVITVFMEVVSLGENFQADLSLAIDEFKMTECDASWFGLSGEEIKTRMGEPSEEAVSNQGVTLLSYDSYKSDDLWCTVTFKLYEEQQNQCSSVSVNWFY